jgi:glycosyltransferase involved in cell wall biosynthesis
VRGSGFYIDLLVKALEKYYPNNKYIYFTRTEKLPENANLVHYPYFEPFFLSLPLMKALPTIVTVHDLIPLNFPKHFPAGLKGRLKWEIQKKSLFGCRAIITDSISSKRDIKRLVGFPEEKIFVVYLAPASEFQEIKDVAKLTSIREKYHLPKNFVLYVGDVTWNKNLPRLIAAVKKINIPLVMVGKALVEKSFDKENIWNRDLIKVQRACQEDKRLIRLGFVSQEDLVMIYNLATVFALPSIYEGFGLPVLEAMACGIPVVAADTSSLPEVCGDAAFMVKPYDVDHIASGLNEALHYDSSQRRAKVERGLAWVKRFSWEKTAKEVFQVYEQI